MEKVKITNYYTLRAVYDALDGECELENGNEVVIVEMPDDSGATCEDGDGVENFYPMGTLYIPRSKYDRLKESGAI